MKRIIWLFFILLFAIALIEISFAQSSREAFKALKKLEAKCQTGISKRDYTLALGDAVFEVNMFLDSDESKAKPKLANSIQKTMSHYQFANKIWDIFIKEARPIGRGYLMFESGPGGYLITERDKEIASLIFQAYPAVGRETKKGGAVFILEEKHNTKAILLSDALSVIWTEASKELKNAYETLKK